MSPKDKSQQPFLGEESLTTLAGANGVYRFNLLSLPSLPLLRRQT
jgi:hypothetical protein